MYLLNTTTVHLQGWCHRSKGRTHGWVVYGGTCWWGLLHIGNLTTPQVGLRVWHTNISVAVPNARKVFTVRLPLPGVARLVRIVIEVWCLSVPQSEIR